MITILVDLIKVKITFQTLYFCDTFVSKYLEKYDLSQALKSTKLNKK
jgi:hypothetical protein